jgi:hypothetical protein
MCENPRLTWSYYKSNLSNIPILKINSIHRLFRFIIIIKLKASHTMSLMELQCSCMSLITLLYQFIHLKTLKNWTNLISEKMKCYTVFGWERAWSSRIHCWRCWWICVSIFWSNPSFYYIWYLITTLLKLTDLI